MNSKLVGSAAAVLINKLKENKNEDKTSEPFDYFSNCCKISNGQDTEIHAYNDEQDLVRVAKFISSATTLGANEGENAATLTDSQLFQNVAGKLKGKENEIENCLKLLNKVQNSKSLASDQPDKLAFAVLLYHFLLTIKNGNKLPNPSWDKLYETGKKNAAENIKKKKLKSNLFTGLTSARVGTGVSCLFIGVFKVTLLLAGGIGFAAALLTYGAVYGIKSALDRSSIKNAREALDQTNTNTYTDQSNITPNQALSKNNEEGRKEDDPQRVEEDNTAPKLGNPRDSVTKNQLKKPNDKLPRNPADSYLNSLVGSEKSKQSETKEHEQATDPLNSVNQQISIQHKEIEKFNNIVSDKSQINVDNLDHNPGSTNYSIIDDQTKNDHLKPSPDQQISLQQSNGVEQFNNKSTQLTAAMAELDKFINTHNLQQQIKLDSQINLPQACSLLQEYFEKEMVNIALDLNLLTKLRGNYLELTEIEDVKKHIPKDKIKSVSSYILDLQFILKNATDLDKQYLNLAEFPSSPYQDDETPGKDKLKGHQLHLDDMQTLLNSQAITELESKHKLKHTTFISLAKKIAEAQQSLTKKTAEAQQSLILSSVFIKSLNVLTQETYQEIVTDLNKYLENDELTQPQAAVTKSILSKLINSGISQTELNNNMSEKLKSIMQEISPEITTATIVENVEKPVDPYNELADLL